MFFKEARATQARESKKSPANTDTCIKVRQNIEGKENLRQVHPPQCDNINVENAIKQLANTIRAKGNNFIHIPYCPLQHLMNQYHVWYLHHPIHHHEEG